MATFETVTAMLLKVKAFMDITPCRMTVFDVSEERYVSILVSSNPKRLLGLLGCEDVGSTLVRNVGEYLLVDAAKRPRRL